MPLRKGQKINRPPKPIAERFATKYEVDETTGCWLWTGHIGKGGYGTIAASSPRREPLLVHRVSYELHVGPIPEGLTIDHVRERGCVHRHCVNPAHLEAVTGAENTRRGGNAAKAECIHGHAFTPENTYRDARGRRCRICMRADRRRSRQRRAA